VRDHNFRAAKDKLEQARSAHRERFAADHLEGRVTFVNDNLNEKSKPVGPIETPRLPDADVKQTESQRLFDQANLMVNSGNYAGAEKGFAAALAADPKNQAADEALQRS